MSVPLSRWVRVLEWLIPHTKRLRIMSEESARACKVAKESMRRAQQRQHKSQENADKMGMVLQRTISECESAKAMMGRIFTRVDRRGEFQIYIPPDALELRYDPNGPKVPIVASEKVVKYAHLGLSFRAALVIRDDSHPARCDIDTAIFLAVCRNVRGLTDKLLEDAEARRLVGERTVPGG